MKRRSLIAAAVCLLGAVLSSGCAGRRTVGHFRDRAERIAVMVEGAELMGARECAPAELARVKVRLDHAIHEMFEGHYPASWTDTDFDEAEALARDLLRKRMLVVETGSPFSCGGGEGQRRGGTGFRQRQRAGAAGASEEL